MHRWRMAVKLSSDARALVSGNVAVTENKHNGGRHCDSRHCYLCYTVNYLEDLGVKDAV